MLDAVHKNTMKPFHAFDVWKTFGESDPHKEEWICCPDCKKPVTPRIDHFRNINNKKISVVSCFQLKNPESGGCIHGETDEHRNAKILLSYLLNNEKITLKINNLSINFKDLKIKGVPELPYRWEQKRENRRSDVLIEFNEWHPILGRGIDFEIQKYEINELELLERENDWVKSGYSMSWIPLNLFDEETLKTDSLEINIIWINRLFQLKHNELSELIVSFERTNEEKFLQLEELYKQEVENIKNNFMDKQEHLFKKMDNYIKFRLDTVEIDLKIPDEEKKCENCKNYSLDRHNPNRYICWRGISKGERLRPHTPDPSGTCVLWSFK